jgi:hypothetical protein
MLLFSGCASNNHVNTPVADAIPNSLTPVTEVMNKEQHPICRNQIITGSRFTKKDCRTSEQWAEADAALAAGSREMVQGIQRTDSGSALNGPK